MDTIPKNIALVVNPLHQTALSVADQIAILLKNKNVEYSIFTAYWPTNWIDFTEAWIVGGDGTLNYFINQYPQIDLPLAIFKGGTGNDFHWLLYGDISIEEQIEKVLTAQPKPVDAGLCNNKLFINGVGIGFDGKVVKDLRGKKKSKRTYMLAVLKNIFGYKEFLCAVNSNNFNWGKKCLMISVANGKRYGGGFQVTPQSVVDDGMLDVNMVGKVHPLMRLRYLPMIEKGKHINLPFVTYVRTGMVIVKSLQELPAHLDGEYYSATEFNIECLPAHFSFLY